MEREPDVHLVQTDEPAIGAHDAEVVGEREHRARGERVTVDRRHGGHAEPGDAAEQRHRGLDEVRRLALPVAAQPVEVQPVRVELLLSADRDQRGRPGRRLHRVQGRVHLVQELAIEAILSRLHGQDEYAAVASQIYHRASPRLIAASRTTSSAPRTTAYVIGSLMSRFTRHVKWITARMGATYARR